MSEGEKQIINFLRILQKNNDIILIDEATSNMDEKTDRIFHDLLFDYVQGGKTLIAITHRLDHLPRYDTIFVMDQGHIVERGSYEELIANPHSFLVRDLSRNKETTKSNEKE